MIIDHYTVRKCHTCGHEKRTGYTVRKCDSCNKIISDSNSANSKNYLDITVFYQQGEANHDILFCSWLCCDRTR